MFAWLSAILFADAVLATATGLVYSMPPFGNIAYPLPLKQKRFLYLIVSYPLAQLSIMLLTGGIINLPNTKHHIPSAFVFLTGHALLAAMAIAASIYLYKRNKENLPFLIANSLVGLAYTTVILVLLQMGWHNS